MSNHQSPTVSIVLPTFNGSKYIRQSIDSCLNQTFKDFELIIVDDCSTDNTSEIIQSYADSRIRYIRNQSNQRLPRSLNIGFAAARGNYLTWTSDDNLYAPQAIEKMLNFLQQREGDFVFCDYYTFEDDHLASAKLVQLPSTVKFDEINPVRACFLYTRKVQEGTGEYDPIKELVEDFEYWIRVSRKFVMRHYPEPIYYYRMHKAQLYNVRYWEVEVVKLLVRLEYLVESIAPITQQFVDLISQKRKLFACGNRTLVRFLFGGKIRKILSAFQSRHIDFKTAKSNLILLMESDLRFILIMFFRNIFSNDKAGKYVGTGVC